MHTNALFSKTLDQQRIRYIYSNLFYVNKKLKGGIWTINTYFTFNFQYIVDIRKKIIGPLSLNNIKLKLIKYHTPCDIS